MASEDVVSEETDHRRWDPLGARPRSTSAAFTPLALLIVAFTVPVAPVSLAAVDYVVQRAHKE